MTDLLKDCFDDAKNVNEKEILVPKTVMYTPDQLLDQQKLQELIDESDSFAYIIKDENRWWDGNYSRWDENIHNATRYKNKSSATQRMKYILKYYRRKGTTDAICIIKVKFHAKAVFE